MLPEDLLGGPFYGPVLEHGNFGIYNMPITTNSPDRPCITSLDDWEMGSIVPILTDLTIAVEADLMLDNNDSMPSTRCLRDESSPSTQEPEQLLAWFKTYFEVGRFSLTFFTLT
jgi:hypothetical protein